MLRFVCYPILLPATNQLYQARFTSKKASSFFNRASRPVSDVFSFEPLKKLTDKENVSSNITLLEDQHFADNAILLASNSGALKHSKHRIRPEKSKINICSNSQERSLENALNNHVSSTAMIKDSKDEISDKYYKSDPALQIQPRSRDIDNDDNDVLSYDPEDDTQRNEKENKVALEQLTPQQRSYLWEDRKKQFSVLNRKFLIALESHLTVLDKALVLLELHDLAIQKRIRLKAELVEDIMIALYTATTNPIGLGGTRGLCSELTKVSGSRYSHNRNRVSLLEQTWLVYRYALESGTDPTPRMVQVMMKMLALCAISNTTIEARAHRLMLDCERFKLRPTQHTIAAYALICGRNNSIHLAVARIADSMVRHDLPLSDGIIAIVLDAFRTSGRADDGLKYLSTISNCPVTLSLVDSVLHCARCSSQPLIAFTFYRAMIGGPAISKTSTSEELHTSVHFASSGGSGLIPGERTINSLLLAQQEARDYSHTSFIVTELRRHRIRCGNDTLNSLLQALVRANLKSEFRSLLSSMRKSGRTIYWEYLPPTWIRSSEGISLGVKPRDDSTGIIMGEIARSIEK